MTAHGAVETPCFMPVGTLADVKLLEPRDRDPVRGSAILVTDDVVVDLPGAEDEARHALAIHAGVVQQWVELALGEILERRSRLLQP